MEEVLRAAGDQVEFLSTLDRQLEDGAACTEIMTKIGQLLDRTIGD